MQKPFDLTKFRTGLTKSITGISAGFHDPRDWISTGNKTLDYLISGDFNGGIPLGKVVDVVSKMNTGGKYDSRAFKKSVGLNGVGTKAVNALQRLLSDDGEVKISISDSQISFELNDNILVSKLIEGNYPNYNQVIPEETKERIPLDRESFLSTVNRVSLLANEKSNSVKCVFSKDQINVTANSQDVGEANETIEVSYKGPGVEIAFNPEFLMAPLRNLDADEIYLELIDEMSPGVILSLIHI